MKNRPFFVLSKNQRTNGFRQRTGPKKKPELKSRPFFVLSKTFKKPMVFDKELAKNKNLRFLEFLISFEKTVVTLKKNWLFENSENWCVSGYVPGMITDGYISFVPRPAQHWFLPWLPEPEPSSVGWGRGGGVSASPKAQAH